MSRSAGRAEAGSVSQADDDAPTCAIPHPNVRPRPFPSHRATRPEEVQA